MENKKIIVEFYQNNILISKCIIDGDQYEAKAINKDKDGHFAVWGRKEIVEQLYKNHAYYLATKTKITNLENIELVCKNVRESFTNLDKAQAIVRDWNNLKYENEYVKII